jgi:release factor glutamine methyltransferase
LRTCCDDLCAYGDDLCTYSKALKEGIATLAANIKTTIKDEPNDNVRNDVQFEAQLLLSEVLATSRAELIAWPERTLQLTQQAQYRQLIERRARGEPIAYILGRREFWGLSLEVAAATLIPRPDTELVVECALAALPAKRNVLCADLGTGSGAIAAALANERPAWTLIAIERCADAAGVAAANVRRLGLKRMHIVRGDWLRALAPASLDAIVSNPPYVREQDSHLRCGDLRFEPRTALTAGADGLSAIRAIIAQAPTRLRIGGWIAIEHGWNQGASVRRLLQQAGFTEIATHRDLSGHERVSTGIRNSK